MKKETNIFFAYTFLLFFIATVSIKTYGMKRKYDKIPDLRIALNNGDVRTLKTVVSSEDFDPEITILTECGELDPFAYLLLQQFPDENITLECAQILCDAQVPIQDTFYNKSISIFDLIQSLKLLKFFVDKKEIMQVQNVLMTYSLTNRNILFQRMLYSITPVEELKKIYQHYDLKLNLPKTTTGTLLHDVLANYLVNNLRFQQYRDRPINRIGLTISANALKKIIAYDDIDQTYKKYKFLIEEVKINRFEPDIYQNQPVAFYCFLLTRLQSNEKKPFALKNYPLYRDLINELLTIKNELNNNNISLARFFEESTRLKELIRNCYYSLK